MSTYRPLKDRIESKREIDPDTGCWNWTGSVGSHGYGQITMYGFKPVLVHRIAAMIYLGHSIYSPEQVLHRCDNRRCFNPEHLFFGDQKANVQDCIQKGRFRGFQ